MAHYNGSATLTENVYTQLRQKILTGVLPQGLPLRVGELKSQFGVSVAIIREALTRLAAEGLAVQHPNIGFSVLAFSPKELENVIKARRINEEAALRLSVANGNIEWEANLIALAHQLELIPYTDETNNTKQNPDWSNIHYKFHRGLIAACDNSFLLDICDRLWYISELYRCCTTPYNLLRLVNDEHNSLMRAAVAHDVEQAVVLLAKHISLIIDQIDILPRL